MKRIALNFALVGALLMSASCSKDADHSAEANNDKDSKEIAKDANEAKFDDSNLEDDAQWAVKAAEGGLWEVKLADLALTKSGSPKVKELAKHIKDDHTKANDELKALAAKKNITLPTSLSEKKQEKYDDFAKKTGSEFDKDYVENMVKDHKDDISLFKKEGENGKDPDVRSWASGKLSTLEHHLQMAEAAETAVKKADKK